MGRTWGVRQAFARRKKINLKSLYYGPSISRPVRSIEYMQGERKRGAVPHRWWWEQQMDLDVNDVIGSDE
jgi:hypothetical protein